jgi:hypothetical protein
MTKMSNDKMENDNMTIDKMSNDKIENDKLENNKMANGKMSIYFLCFRNAQVGRQLHLCRAVMPLHFTGESLAV